MPLHHPPLLFWNKHPTLSSFRPLFTFPPLFIFLTLKCIAFPPFLSQDVLNSLVEKLSIKNPLYLSLCVEHVKIRRRNKLILLDPKDSLSKVGADIQQIAKSFPTDARVCLPFSFTSFHTTAVEDANKIHHQTLVHFFSSLPFLHFFSWVPSFSLKLI